MTMSEAMIAMIAVRATVWPNVGPIESKLKLATPNSSSQGALDPGAGRSQLLGGDLEAVVALDLRAAQALDLGVAEAGAGQHAAHAVLVGGPDELGLDPRARLEVDAEVQALAADRQRADEQDHARRREEPLRTRP